MWRPRSRQQRKIAQKQSKQEIGGMWQDSIPEPMIWPNPDQYKLMVKNTKLSGLQWYMAMWWFSLEPDAEPRMVMQIIGVTYPTIINMRRKIRAALPGR